MSIYPMARVWDHSQQRGTHLLLLLSMADSADELGVLWAGNGFLGRRARITDDRQVRRMLRHLESTGEIVVVRSRRRNGLNLPNYYIVTPGATAAMLHDAQDRVAQMIAIRGGIVARGGDSTPTKNAPKKGGGGGKKRPKVGAEIPPLVGAVVPPDPIDPEEEDLEDHPSVEILWRVALEELEMQTSRATYRAHLANTTATLDGDELTIRAWAFSIDYLSGRLHDLIRRTTETLAGRPLTIRYEVAQ